MSECVQKVSDRLNFLLVVAIEQKGEASFVNEQNLLLFVFAGVYLLVRRVGFGTCKLFPVVALIVG